MTGKRERKRTIPSQQLPTYRPNAEDQMRTWNDKVTEGRERK
jgi:hypothetical protein